MTEMEFAERLKKLRKEKKLTQQELADLLGVSNKTVSRWETGGYPDVTMLAPLARALGVSVDALLGEEPPLRSLGRADWQNLLSFAFAIGGGILFFLLNLFTPVPVCYLLYLGAMAYGVYLQRHYTCHSRWFHSSNLVMNFFVNVRLVSPVVALFSFNLASLLEAANSGSVAPALWLRAYLPCFVVAGALTLITRAVIQRTDSGESRPLSLPRMRRAPFSAAKLLPLLIPVLSSCFWLLYTVEESGQPAELPRLFYAAQQLLFLVLVLVLTIAGALWLIRVRHHWMLVPMLLMSWSCAALLPGCVSRSWKFTYQSCRVYHMTVPAGQSYTSFGVPTVGLLVAAVIIIALYTLCCFLRFERSEKKITL